MSWRPGTRKEEDRADIRDTGGHALSLSTKYILPHHSFVRRNIEYGHLNTVRKLLGLKNQKHMQRAYGTPVHCGVWRGQNLSHVCLLWLPLPLPSPGLTLASEGGECIENIEMPATVFAGTCPEQRAGPHGHTGTSALSASGVQHGRGQQHRRPSTWGSSQLYSFR